MSRLDARGFGGAMFNIIDNEKYTRAMQLLRESLFDGGATLFAADNVITWNKNYSFLRDDFFIDFLKNEQNTVIERSTVWRLYVLLYFADIASRVEGDFVELGCHTGNSAAHVVKKVDFAKSGKQYYLYDIFEWNEDSSHSPMPGHANPNMHKDVVDRFADKPFVKVIKGPVPDSFKDGFPDGPIAFAHIDMNDAAPEVAALKKVLPLLSKGGIILFDDYGWWGYSAQKAALDPILAEHGLNVLELPTGQAILINS